MDSYIKSVIFDTYLCLGLEVIVALLMAKGDVAVCGHFKGLHLIAAVVLDGGQQILAFIVHLNGQLIVLFFEIIGALFFVNLSLSHTLAVAQLPFLQALAAIN